MTPDRLSGMPLRAFVLLLTLAGVAACDEDPPPETRVTSVVVASGDGQQAAVGTAVAQPLIAEARDGAGNPVRGARVEWTVVSGAGTVTAVTDRTDDQGRAVATWTLGTTAGQQTALIRVGVATLVFTATARPGPATQLAVTPAALMLDAIGASGDLTIVARDAHNNLIEGRTPTWSSGNNAIATVSPAGRVTATGRGSTTVRATLEGVTADASVTVEPTPASIQVTPSAPRLEAVGATVQLQARALDRNGNEVTVPAEQYVWSSSNPAIITVSATGLVTAVATGSANARAALPGVTGQATVTVAPVATSLVVSPKTDTLTTARPTVQLTVVARDANNNVIPAPAVTWSSTNPQIATVSASGLVTAVSNGVTKIGARSGTATDTATITIRLNTAARPKPDTIGVIRDMTRNVAAPGILANDSLGIPPGVVASFGGGSLAGDVTTYGAGATATFGTGGSLTIGSNGAVTFTPSNGFTGSFTVRYRVQNAAGVADTTVTFLVGDPPSAADDNYMTNVNTEIVVAAPGLLANDMLGLPAGSITSFGGGSIGGVVTSFQAGVPVAFNIGGLVRVNPDGSFNFRPPTGQSGTFTFLYRLTSSAGTSDATVSIQVVVPPPVP